MRRPLLSVAVVYTAGILVGEFVRAPLTWLFGACVASTVIALASARFRAYLLMVTLLLAGWTNMIWRTAVVSPSDLRVLLSDKPEFVSITGTLRNSPAEHIFERHHEEAMRTVAYVDVAQLSRGTNSQAAVGQVIVMTPGVLADHFFMGQRVKVTGVILPPSGPFADGLFDFKSFLKRKGVYFQLRVTSTNDWQLAGADTSRPVADRFAAYAKKTLALGSPKEDLPLRLIWTLVLDWKAPMTPAVEEPLVKAGTFHIFAVDGLRIALITGMLMTFLQVLQVPRSVAGLITIPAIWFYAGLTGFPPSAIRAAIMATVVVAGWSLKRPSDTINSLFAAALIILLWDPQQLFQPGFQLSFIVVLCILLVLPLIREWVSKPFAPDPYLPQQVARLQFWNGDFIAGPRQFFLDTFAVSLAAWLGSIPLAAYYFHVFNIVSTPANFVVVPLTALTLISSLGSLLTGAVLPGMAVIFNHASWLLMKQIILISQWSVQWRPAAINVSAPTLLTTFWYYAILLALLSGWILRTKYKRSAIVVLSCFTVFCLVQWCVPKPTKLHILPLNGGECVLIDSGGVKTELLVDCGDEPSVERITKPFLQAQGVNWLESCCLTVAHQSAMGGAEIVQTNYYIDHIATSPTRNRSPIYKRALATFAKTPAQRRMVKTGDHISGWAVLHPDAEDQFSRADDNAIVLQRKIGDTSLVLLSTLGRAGQIAMAGNNPDLRADIVVAGLPTADEPLCQPLLDVLQPKLIVIVDSEYPANLRASAKLRMRLANQNARVIYCHDAGAVTFVFKAQSWSLVDASGAVLASAADLEKNSRTAATGSFTTNSIGD